VDLKAVEAMEIEIVNEEVLSKPCALALFSTRFSSP